MSLVFYVFFAALFFYAMVEMYRDRNRSFKYIVIRDITVAAILLIFTVFMGMAADTELFFLTKVTSASFVLVYAVVCLLQRNRKVDKEHG